MPYEDQAGANDGAVNVIYGGPEDCHAAGDQVWEPGQRQGWPVHRRQATNFGYSLAAGDQLRQRVSRDLAVGVPYEDQAGTNDGAVNVIYGSGQRSQVAGNEVWSQGGQGVARCVRRQATSSDTAWPRPTSATAPRADLAIGVPSEDQAATDDGAVNVIYGAASGLTVAGDDVWSQGSLGIAGAPEAGDRFGTALGARRS